MAFMSGSELIEAFRGRIPVTDCATELAAYRRVRAAAQSGPRLEQCASDIDPEPQMEASEMQKVWWKWWRGSEKPESMSLTLASQNTPSALAEKSIKSLVEKHPILLSRFVESGDKLFVSINDVSKFKVDNLSTFDSAAEALQSYQDWKKEPIRHEGDWLVRAAVAMLKNDAIVTLEVSHLICDAHSMTVLEADLRQMLARNEIGHAEKPRKDFSFFDYADAERRWYQSDNPLEIISYWTKRVDCSPGVSSPSGIPIGGRISGPRTRFQISLSPVLVQQILSLGKKLQTTPYVPFMTAYALALTDWTSCSKFYISSVYDLRNVPALFSTVGYLTATRLTEVSFSDAINVREAINHVWLQDQFSRSIPLPAGAGDNPTIRNGVSAMLNFIPTNASSSQPRSGQSEELPCIIGEPLITEPRPSGHPISLLLRGMPDGGIRGALDFGGDHISLDEMRALANSLKARLVQISQTI
jgi:hypothetical protein